MSEEVVKRKRNRNPLSENVHEKNRMQNSSHKKYYLTSKTRCSDNWVIISAYLKAVNGNSTRNQRYNNPNNEYNILGIHEIPEIVYENIVDNNNNGIIVPDENINAIDNNGAIKLTPFLAAVRRKAI